MGEFRLIPDFWLLRAPDAGNETPAERTPGEAPQDEEDAKHIETLDVDSDPSERTPKAGRQMPVLVVLNESSPDDLHVLRKRETVVGRDPRSDITLEDSRVSRSHATIVYENIEQPRRPPSCLLFDNDSRNGTFLNGKRIEKPKALRSSDRIVIGSTVLGFFLRTELELQSDTAVRAMLASRGYRPVEKRITLDLPVELSILLPEETFHPTNLRAVAKDLSRTGMKLITHEMTREIYIQTLRTTRYVKTQIRLPGAPEPLSLRGRAAWIHYDSHQTPPCSTLGVEFENLDEAAVRAIESLLDTL